MKVIVIVAILVFVDHTLQPIYIERIDDVNDDLSSNPCFCGSYFATRPKGLHIYNRLWEVAILVFVDHTLQQIGDNKIFKMLVLK
mgnify:CR=1 FL=1